MKVTSEEIILPPKKFIIEMDKDEANTLYTLLYCTEIKSDMAHQLYREGARLIAYLGGSLYGHHVDFDKCEITARKYPR